MARSRSQKKSRPLLSPVMKPITRSQTFLIRTYDKWRTEEEKKEGFHKACNILSGDPDHNLRRSLPKDTEEAYPDVERPIKNVLDDSPSTKDIYSEQNVVTSKAGDGSFSPQVVEKAPTMDSVVATSGTEPSTEDNVAAIGKSNTFMKELKKKESRRIVVEKSHAVRFLLKSPWDNFLQHWRFYYVSDLCETVQSKSFLHIFALLFVLLSCSSYIYR